MSDETPIFSRKERLRIEALEKRLAHVLGDHPERSGDSAYPPGEAAALAWVLAVLQGRELPLEIRVERLEYGMRKLGSRVGRIEQDLEEEDE